MQYTIDIPNAIIPTIQTMAKENGKSELDMIKLALLNYFQDDDSDIIAVARQRLANPAPRIKVTLDEL